MKSCHYLLLLLFLAGFSRPVPAQGDTSVHTGTLRIKKKAPEGMLYARITADSVYAAAIGKSGAEKNELVSLLSDTFRLDRFSPGALFLSLPGPAENAVKEASGKIKHDYRAFFNGNLRFAFPGSQCPRKDTISIQLYITAAGKVKEMNALRSTDTGLLLACFEAIKKNTAWEPAFIGGSDGTKKEAACRLSIHLFFETGKP